MPDPDYKAVLLSLLGSLTLCDHMGDVGNDMSEALKQIGMGDLVWDEPQDLARELGKLGVKTLHGTELWSPDDETEAND